MSNSENIKSYRSVFKATSLFGGVQFFNILIQLIRSKILAILLGPLGMGIIGLLMSTIDIISSFTNFGLGVSAIKDISEAHNTKNDEKISFIIGIFKKLVIVTGILGFAITIILSPILSKITFGNLNYKFAFIFLSVTLLFNQLSTGELALIQGTRHLKYLAKANIFSSLFGLIITIPIYYFLKSNGIIIAIISSTILSYCTILYFSKKIIINQKLIYYKDVYEHGKKILITGILISISGLLTMLASYIIRVFVGRIGGLAQVGLYTAGFSIINTYFGLIFNAMATDYYPKLSISVNDREATNLNINNQSEIALIILAPMLIIFLVLIKPSIILLFSSNFLPITWMLYWASLGKFFKAPTWAVGFLFLAKGNNKIFFISELFSTIYTLILNLIGYYYWGLDGLGISFLISYIISLIQVYILGSSIYKFRFSFGFLKIIMIQFLLAIFSFLILKFINNNVFFILFSIILVFASISYSLFELNKRISLLDFFKNSIIYQKIKCV